MGIPYYRRVCHTDEDCTRYQCLACGDGWESRTDPAQPWDPSGRWRFCPYCGVEWKGKHECRDHGYPAWAYNRKIDWWELPSERRYPRRPDLEPWIIETQTWIDGTVYRDWHVDFSERNSVHRPCKPESALQSLRWERERESKTRNEFDFGCHNYYRLRLKNHIVCEESPRGESEPL